MNTRLDLEYRDASNYKANICVVLEGEITPDMISQIGDHLDDGDCIIADQVGLPTPSEQLFREFDGPSEDDHVYTAIEQWSDGDPVVADFLTDAPPTLEMSVWKFTQIITSTVWDVSREMMRLDIPA